MTQLRRLDVQNNRLTKLEGLESLRQLEEFYVAHNGVPRLENLDGLVRRSLTIFVVSHRILSLDITFDFGCLPKLLDESDQLELSDQLGGILGAPAEVLCDHPSYLSPPPIWFIVLWK